MLHLPAVLTPAEVGELRQRAARKRSPLNDVAGSRPEDLRLTGIYHRIVRMWARH